MLESSVSHKKTLFPLHSILGKAAVVRNLKNKYGRERWEIITSKTSGSSTKDIQVQISNLHPSLARPAYSAKSHIA